MGSKLKKNEKGFTIIEVLIVLAIAGLIMVIVFLAVPALQRNSRNTQRSADAAKISGAISSCLGSRNGDPASCNTLALLQANGGLNLAELQQITAVNVGAGAPANFNTANFAFNQRCADNGGGVGGVGASTRTAVVLYQAENNTAAGLARCINAG